MKEKVLIIDDEVDICVLLGGILKGRNFDPLFANTLKEGFSQLSLTKPSIVFLDINLPDGSGLEAISKIKEISGGTRIVMISAYDGPHERLKASAEGANAFIGKPFNKENVYFVVDHLLITFPHC